MKNLFLSFSMLLIAGVIYGQAEEGSVEFQRKQLSAATIELPYRPEVVKAALNDYLSKKGKSNSGDLKGFTSFRNTQASLSDSANADLYFKVERKNRSERQTTIVSLLLTPPKDGSDTQTDVNYLNMDEAKAHLNELASAIVAYDLEAQIKQQNEVLIKAESKYKTLVDDGADLEKKRLAIEKKIIDNKSDQRNQMSEIERQKQELELRVGKRKSY